MLPLYCGPTIIKFVQGKSDDHAERLCRYAMGVSRRVGSMRVDKIVEIISSLGYACLEPTNLKDLEGKKVVSRAIQQEVRDAGGWMFCVLQYPGVRSNHLVVLCGSEYKDNGSKGKWRPVKELTRSVVVDMWVITKSETRGDQAVT